jgi:hypothetical protein
MTELMRKNPDFTAFDIRPSTIFDAGVIACASMKILLGHGEGAVIMGARGSASVYGYISPDESYTAVAVRALEEDEPDPTNILGFFPNNEHRNYTADVMVTVTTRRAHQYRQDSTNTTMRVVQTRLLVPGMDRADGKWLGSDGAFERDGRPDIDAEAALLAGSSASTTLAANVHSALRVVHDVIGDIGR